MPELPEIETIRTGLVRVILGRRIESVEIRQKNLRWPVDEVMLDEWIVGQAVEGVRRRAKYLIWSLKNRASLIIHLGMSGRLGIFLPHDPVEKHTHVIFMLSGGVQIRFRDPRRFGGIDVVIPGGLMTYPRFRHIGVEPLSNDLSVEYAFNKFRLSKRPIKNVLMDARIIAGIGNIYASEALFLAKLHPLRAALSLTRRETASMVDALRRVLNDAVQKGGTTLRDHQNILGEPGFFQNELSVYGRENQACPHCSALIERRVIQGRSTFFCPRCQQ